MRASSRKLAEALAARLNEVVPEPCRVEAESKGVSVYAVDALLGGSDAPLMLEDDDDCAPGERLTGAAYFVLSGVQDCICEYLGEPWPSADGRNLAMPQVRSDERQVALWYGSEDREAAVISLPPILIAEISDTHGGTPGQA